MNEIERIDENSVSSCGYTYSKSQTPQKMVSDEEPEFWKVIPITRSELWIIMGVNNSFTK